jgi:gamma-glutamylcyclotransferase (GGCT)/AIG2-like uncharacterized protein YtfP
MPFYFAYGSNLDAVQMAARWPEATAVTTAVLANHRLAFAGHSRNWGGAVATLVAQDGAEVRGVVYAVSEAGLQALDAFEGVPVNYTRTSFEVIAPTGATLAAWAYVKPPEASERGQPSHAYLETLRRAYDRLGFDRRLLEGAYGESLH